jgi:ParB family chromosome partitioning protein
LHEVPVLVRDFDDRETAEIALIENLQRQDLSPLEESEGYSRLMSDFSHTQEALAQALGKSRSHIANSLRLLTLPAPIKQMLSDRVLSPGHARALLGANNAVELANQIVKKGLNVRQTEKLVKSDGGKTARQKKPSSGRTSDKDPDTVALEHDLSNMLGLAVNIDFDGAGGKISVRYETLEQLDDILKRLSQGRLGESAPVNDEDDPLVPEGEGDNEFDSMFIDDDLLTDELESIADATEIALDAEDSFLDEPEGDMPIEQDEVGEEALETLSDAKVLKSKAHGALSNSDE